MTANSDARPPRALYSIALIALAGVWLAMWVGGGGALDRQIYLALYAGHAPALLKLARGVTALGNPSTLLVAGCVVAAWVWWRRGHPHLALALMLVIIIGRILSASQKHWIARPRPDVEPHLVVVHTSSFPSGHASSSMVFYVAAALALFPTGRPRQVAVACAILMSMLIGLSRVMLGVHWPSDVVGGWSFGLLWVALTLERAKKLLGAET